MARRRQQSSSSVESDSQRAKSSSRQHGQTLLLPASETRQSPRKKAQNTPTRVFDAGTGDEKNATTALKLKDFSSEPLSKPIKIRLASLQKSNSFLSAPNFDDLEPSKRRVGSPGKYVGLPRPKVCASSRKLMGPAHTPYASELVDEDATTNRGDGVWCASEHPSESSEDELPSPRKFLSTSKPRLPQNKHDANNLHSVLQGMRSLKLDRAPLTADSDSLDVKSPEFHAMRKQSLMSSSDKENDGQAILSFTPPKLLTITKAAGVDRPTTPPPSSPSKLKSPSKTKNRIPMAPLRPSLDAFWNASTVNDWNDQYSPQKPLRSPSRNRSVETCSPVSPTLSPIKSKNPEKPNKAQNAAKRDFEAHKRELADRFLAELDDKLTGGSISRLSSSTGGVRIIWSKTLNSTAGRANWRRETVKTAQPKNLSHGESSFSSLTPTVSLIETVERHHASIELAEKVIACSSDRLLNTLAHEFCHLANFMISGVKDQPHGKSFKAWGSKCNAVFSDRGVEVTTKHTYQIDYKYVWRCENEYECGAEFKRHSKSIDPKRQRCGTCKSGLVQIKPVPRKTGAGKENGIGGGGGHGAYAEFVKNNYAAVRKDMAPGASQKEVMEAVGSKYRAAKANNEAEQGKLAAPSNLSSEVEYVTQGLQLVVLDD